MSYLSGLALIFSENLGTLGPNAFGFGELGCDEEEPIGFLFLVCFRLEILCFGCTSRRLAAASPFSFVN